MATYKKGNYWGKTQENAVLAWVSATTEFEYTKAYNVLLPPLKIMSEVILNTYFFCPFNKIVEIQKDGIQLVFLKLKEFQPDRGASGGYSFCSMILKHYYLENLILDKNKMKHVNNMFDLVDQYPEEKKPIDYGENLQIDYKAVLSRFKQLIINTEKEIATTEKIAIRRTYKPTQKSAIARLVVLKLCYEFVERYESLDPTEMTEYVKNNKSMNISHAMIVRHLKKLFGINLAISKIERETLNTDDKYNYFQDDVTPRERKYIKRNRKKRIKTEYNSAMYDYF